MRLFVIALCIVVSQRASEAEPSGPWSFAARAGVAYQHRSDYFTFSAPRYGVQLGVGHEVAPDWTLGLRVDIRPSVEIGGGDFQRFRDVPFYSVEDQTGNLFIERRWDWLTGSAALGVRREEISGYYLSSAGPGPYLKTGEDFVRFGVVGSIGVGGAYHLTSSLGFEVRLEASASLLGDGTERYVLYPVTTERTKDGPDSTESAFDMALWLGLRWN